ncbi:DUF4397 domain-containing protein [Hymenobacter sp. BT507]|uniref:DUF4397 domain-containing protein n=1 Tax=Hymenobacter citatus TaxID=2763506 RepID=A0ABR7MM05_9BACT|nr:DUF4397 domain-containing protein [Hymenobacter citatus]MBC6612075.1 DUF4397 domain-containing protein [Hymenobacter citatus]
MTRILFPVSRIGTIFVPALLALTSCNDTENTPAAGKLSIVHVASAVPTSVNARVDEQTAKTLYYGQSTGYNELSAGAHTLVVEAVATPSNQLSVPLTINSRKFHSVYIYNSSSTQVAALSLMDDLTIPSAGKAHLRFINLGYEAPRITLRNHKAGSTPYVLDVAFRSNTGFLVIDPDTVTLRAVQPSGTVVATTSQPSILRAGKLYNVVLRGAAATTTTPGSLALSVEEL